MIIELSVLAIAAVVGAAAARVRRNHRQAEVSPPSPAPSAPAPFVDFTADESPLAIGDVIILDQGRGRELCMQSRLVLSELDSPPFLRLFAASSERGAGAVVGCDPRRSEHIDVMESADLGVGANWTLSRRPPSTVEARIEGVTLPLRLRGRRIARAETDATREADSPEAKEVDDVVAQAPMGPRLPAPGDETLVAIYRGEGDAVALLIRESSGAVHSYAGRTIALAATSRFGGATAQSATAPQPEATPKPPR